LTGGYQARAAALAKQITDSQESIEQARLELSTFTFLSERESASMPRRLASITEDVERQQRRERDLQTRFSEVQYKLQQAQPQPY